MISRTLSIFVLSLSLQPLCILKSQEWEWSNHLEGSGDVFPSSNVAIDIVTDNSNNVYYCGSYNSSPLTIGNLSVANSGNWDGFVCKFDSKGNPLWLKQIGGTGSDEARALCLVGNYLYVVGSYKSSPCSFASDISLANEDGNFNIYLAKYDLDGNCLEATRLFWGDGVERFKDIVYDKELERLIVIGQFKENAAYFNGTSDITVIASSDKDMFIAQIDTLGTVTAFKNFATTNTRSIFKNISLCSDEGYYVTGDLAGTLYFSANDLLISEDNARADILAIKFNKSLEKIWARKGGGTGYDHANASTSDANGDLYLAGKVSANVYFDSTATFLSHKVNNRGDINVFLAKYNKQGTLLWLVAKGEVGIDDGFGLSAYENKIGLCGTYAGGIVFGNDSLQSSSTTENNAYCAYFDFNGHELGAHDISGDAEESAMVVVFDNTGAAIIGGYSYSSPFTIGDSAYTVSSGRDGFIAKHKNSLATNMAISY